MANKPLQWQKLMESLTRPCSPFHPLHHRSHILGRPKFGQQLYFVTKFPRHSNCRLLHLAAFRTHQALAEAASSPAGGDLSVLIPISVVMLSLYWVANFVVPGMIAKDLQGQPAAPAKEVGVDDEESRKTGEENMGAVEPNRKADEPKTTASSTAR